MKEGEAFPVPRQVVSWLVLELASMYHMIFSTSDVQFFFFGLIYIQGEAQIVAALPM